VNDQLSALDYATRILRYDQPSKDTVDTLRAEILAGQPDWGNIVGLVNHHLLTPAMWLALNKKALIDELPVDLAAYLHDLYQLNCERNHQLRNQLLEAVRQLNHNGIIPVLLKGAKHLVTEIYSGPGARIMTDIDLLVRQEDITSSLDSLIELGYEPVEDKHGDYHEEHHHCSPMFRSGAYGAIEIHRRLAEYPYELILPTELVLAETEPLIVEQAHMRVLTPTHRILHNIVHSQLIDHLHDNGTIPLRSLHEVYCEQAAYSSHIDWAMISRQMNNNKRGRVLRAYLFMMKTLYGSPSSSEARPTLAAHLYYQRCRAQLAWRKAHEWGLRYGRYSPDMLNDQYGYGRGWGATFRSRMRRLAEKLSEILVH